MRVFTYTAVDGEGRRVGGSRRASSQAGVERHLEGLGFAAVEVFSPSIGSARKNRVPLKDLSVFCRMLSVVFASQLPLSEGLNTIAEQTGNKALRSALQEIYQFMKNGYTFGDGVAMYPHIFGAYPVNLIEVGEASGTLDGVLGRLAEYFDKEDKTRRKLVSAISYPLTLTALMSVIIALLVVKIIPMFESTLAELGGEVPMGASIIFKGAKLASRHFPIIAISLAALVAALAVFLHTPPGRRAWDQFRVTAPVFKYVNARVITSRYARGLSILLKSGFQLMGAMQENIKLVNNAHLEKRFTAAVEKLKAGAEFDDIFSEIKIFPPLFIKLASLGHSAGQLDEMLDRSASIFDDEVDRAIDKVAQTVEPALIIALSIVIGVILLSVILPMISVMNAIG